MGEHHGTFDSQAEAAACLVFERLAPHQVEIVADVSELDSMTSW